jgi:hypothetical protein
MRTSKTPVADTNRDRRVGGKSQFQSEKSSSPDNRTGDQQTITNAERRSAADFGFASDELHLELGISFFASRPTILKPTAT